MLRNCSFFLLLVSFTSLSQEIKLPNKTSQNIVAIPGSDLMIDRYEVTLGDWFAFLYSMYNSGTGSEFVMAMAPEREQVPEKLHPVLDLYLEQYADEIFSQNFQAGSNSNEVFPIPAGTKWPDLLDFPVTGISFHQVEEYLLWRQDLALQDKRIARTGYSVRARLPQPGEWDKIAAIYGPRDIDNATIYPDSMNTHGCYLMNVKYREPCESTVFLIEKWGEGMFQMASYYPDTGGIYDLFGNVAEMTAREGVAIGGSYHHWAREGWPGKKINYNGPTQWLGFRVWFQFYHEN